MQKNLRSDLGSERRSVSGTGEGNVNFAFSRVSFPDSEIVLISLKCKLRGSFFNVLACIWSQSVSQEQREKRVTVDEVPSGIYLYPEEESETDKILTPPSTRYSSDLFEEGKKDILKLMGIEVCFLFPRLIIFIDTWGKCLFLCSQERPLGCQHLKIVKKYCYILITPLLRHLKCCKQRESSSPHCVCFFSSLGPVTNNLNQIAFVIHE